MLRALTIQLRPDIALLRPRGDYYRSANPEPRDVLLVIEVMDSCVDRDRGVKLRLYARAGLAEVWLAELASDTVEICRDPVGGEYRDRHMTRRGDSVRALAFPDLTFEVAAILG